MPLSMTAQWVERVPGPAEGRVDYFDEKIAGLGIRVSFTGKKVWFVQYRVKGDSKRRRLTLEPYPQISLADARDRAREVLLEASKGNDPAGKKQEEKAAATFEELALLFLEKHASQKRSRRDYERVVKKDLIPAWGRRKANEIKRRDVIAMIERIQDRGAPIAANRTLAMARKLFNWAIERDLLETNPCYMVKRVVKEQSRDNPMTNAQIRAIWKAFEAEELLVRTMFKLRLLTAQRGGEIETMRWADLDMESGWWTIPSARAKNGLSHRVYLSGPVRKLLEEVRKQTGQSEWVFPSPKRPSLPFRNVQKPTARVKATSRVDFVLHDLRRIAASEMTGMEINRLVVSKILNHVEQGVTRVYDRYSYDAEKRHALEAWAAKLESILQGESDQEPSPLAGSVAVT